MPSQRSQFSKPLVVTPDGQCRTLERVVLSGMGQGRFNEDWLQSLLFKTPALLPINEVEPAFSGAMALCRELPTNVGPLDLLLVNELGLLTLVECKLWRNPEARRAVVGQILDYAQEISRWDYTALDAAIRKASDDPGTNLWTRAAAAFGLVDEAAFVDRVNRNLKESRFLLLIVGDGIRENTEQIGEYLKAHAGLSFTLGLVEQQVFELPEGGRFLVQPRVLAKTVEIGRLIVRAESGRVEVDQSGMGATPTEAPVARTLTEEVFIEEVAGKTSLAADLRAFFDAVKGAGMLLVTTDSEKSFKICSPRLETNLLTIHRSGMVRNHGVGESNEGREYLAKLSALIPNTKVREFNDSGWRMSVTRMDGTPLRIEELLSRSGAALELLSKTAAIVDAGNYD